MKKILLFGAYSDNNLGDDLILFLVNRLIKRKHCMPLVLNRYGMNDFFTNNYNFVDNSIYDPKFNSKKIKRIFTNYTAISLYLVYIINLISLRIAPESWRDQYGNKKVVNKKENTHNSSYHTLRRSACRSALYGV